MGVPSTRALLHCGTVSSAIKRLLLQLKLPPVPLLTGAELSASALAGTHTFSTAGASTYDTTATVPVAAAGITAVPRHYLYFHCSAKLALFLLIISSGC